MGVDRMTTMVYMTKGIDGVLGRGAISNDSYFV